MSDMLKEALKALCGLRQWSYAVFWKFGLQNLELLIWEECHVESLPYSVLPGILSLDDIGSNGQALEAVEGHSVSLDARSFQVGVGDGQLVQSLINKMMAAKQVHVLGKGLVGRTAFSGNHRWIILKNYIDVVEPIEVLNEVQLQFSGGMQTVAVIPVLPHGVIQFGATLTILEDITFVEEVKSIIFQMGCLPLALLSGSCISNESLKDIGVPVPCAKHPFGQHQNSEKINSVLHVTNCSNIKKSLAETAELVSVSPEVLGRHTYHKALTATSTVGFADPTQYLSKSNGVQFQTMICQQNESNLSHQNYLENEFVGSKAVSPGHLSSHLSSLYNLDSRLYGAHSGGSHRSSVCMGDQVILGADTEEGADQDMCVVSNFMASQIKYLRRADGGSFLSAISEPSVNLSKQLGVSPCAIIPSSKDMTGTNRSVDFSAEKHSISNSMVSDGFDTGHYSALEMKNSGHYSARKEEQKHMFDAVNMASFNVEECRPSSLSIPGPFGFLNRSHSGSFKDFSENVYANSASADYLSEIFDNDRFKNKLVNDNETSTGLGIMIENMIKEVPGSMNSGVRGSEWDNISESEIFSGSGSDHLLDAVVSGVACSARQIVDGKQSSKSTITKVSNSLVHSVATCHSSMPSHAQESQDAHSKSVVGSGETGNASSISVRVKGECGNCSQKTSSQYGSNISSLIEKSSFMKRNIIIAAANSKYADVGKLNQKKLKRGENPRPRPKDRQMIQDRMKELREIVPNGAKCSIDALLERTIKHMLFLESVTKHADKMKQMAESKMINEDAGLPLKDNYEGGATWAFEVGSHSLACPIVVEDLKPPRQLLVEMLCEERGFFLEIADIIRGMGLTILRGVLETHNDKIWARFAVEANRDVTRMEIFIPLVHLLEQTMNRNGADEDSKAGQPAFQYPTPTPTNQLVDFSFAQ